MMALQKCGILCIYDSQHVVEDSTAEKCRWFLTSRSKLASKRLRKWHDIVANMPTMMLTLIRFIHHRSASNC